VSQFPQTNFEMLGMYLGPGVECGSADLQMFTCVKCGFQCGSKSALCPLVKIFFCHKLFEKSPHTALLLLSVLQCNVDVYCSRLLF